MRKTLHAAMWACVGAQLAFITVMQTMQDVLSDDRSGLTPQIIEAERGQFLSVQLWSLILTLAIGTVVLYLDYQDRKRAMANG